MALKIEDQPVPKRRMGDRSQVLARYLGSTLQNGSNLGPQDECLGAARAGAETHVAADRLRGLLAVRMGRRHQRDTPTAYLGGNLHAADEIAHLGNPRAVYDRLGVRGVALGGALENLLQLPRARRPHRELEEETVDLGFRQGIGAFHFQRVLRGDQQKRRGEREGLGRQGNLLFLHRLQHGRLRLGRGAVDVVGQHHVGEKRPAVKLERAAPIRRLHHHVGADHVGGHQVGCALDALEAEVQHSAEGSRQQGLAQARKSFQQHVSAGNQRRQRAGDHVLLTHDDLADLRLHGIKISKKTVPLLIRAHRSYSPSCQGACSRASPSEYPCPIRLGQATAAERGETPELGLTVCRCICAPEYRGGTITHISYIPPISASGVVVVDQYAIIRFPVEESI